MNIHELIISRRTIRQFQNRPVSRALLDKVVDAGRLAPSAANVQPLVFIVVDDPPLREKVFPCLKWAAYIQPKGNPLPGQEPQAYVVVGVDTAIREKMYEYDVGAAVENMALAALGEGVGGCWLISIDRPGLQAALGTPETVRLDSVLALGYPAEHPVVEAFLDSPKYWKDDAGVLHVPKRARESVIRYNRF